MPQLIDLGKLRFYWTGDWSSTQQYEVNDVVRYGGNVYVYTYTLADTGIVPTDTTHWALMIQGIRFQGVYDPAKTYRVGDGAAYGGTVYLALKDNTNVAPTDATNGAANWTKFLDGIQYEGNYSATTAYQKGDLVLYGANAYIATRDSTGNAPTNTTYFDRLIGGVDITGAWAAATAYRVGQVVAYGARLFQATTDVAAGVAPVNASNVLNAGWRVFVDGIRPRGTWAVAQSYLPNDVVTYGGSTYINGVAHASGSGTFPGSSNDTYWTKYNSGVRWRGTLTAGTAYQPDDLVTDGVSTYISVGTFTATSIVAAEQTYTDQSNTTRSYLTVLSKGADNLPPQGGNSGRFLQTNGVSAAWAFATPQYRTATAAVTAVNGDAFLCDTSAGTFTVTLPAAPAISNVVQIVDLAGTFDQRPVTILRNGNRIMGVADDLTANTRNASFGLVYSGATYGWKVI